MIVFINSQNEIKDVNTTTDATLTPIEMPKDNPFDNWTVAKILCHKLYLTDDGKYKGFYPAVDTRIIEHIDRLGNTDKAISNDVTDTQMGLAETYEKAVTTEGDVTDIELAITEIYEMILGGV